MESDHLSRLKEEQEKAIQVTKEKIHTWDKFKSDYKALQDRLLTLPNEFSHDVMQVPFGRLAFMPGKLVHSNQLLVLLGDNWFVDRSAKQAHDMVSRRIKVIDENVSSLNEQRALLEPRADFTREFQEERRGAMLDISETITEKEADEWKARHAKNVQKFHNSLQREKESLRNSIMDEEMWKRLDELEKLETEGKEMDRLPEFEANPLSLAAGDRDGGPQTAGDPQTTGGPGSQTGDDGDEDDDEDDWETESSDSREDAQADRSRVIHVRHTPRAEADEKWSETENKKAMDASDFHITSPGDIYKYFGEASKLKTILKSDSKTQRQKGKQRSSVSFEIPEPVSKEMTKVEDTVKSPHVKAFLDEVVEAHSSGEMINIGEQTQPKRVSKFKSQRRRQQSENR